MALPRTARLGLELFCHKMGFLSSEYIRGPLPLAELGSGDLACRTEALGSAVAVIPKCVRPLVTRTSVQ